jgi:hypothetical protein
MPDKHNPRSFLYGHSVPLPPKASTGPAERQQSERQFCDDIRPRDDSEVPAAEEAARLAAAAGVPGRIDEAPIVF